MLEHKPYFHTMPSPKSRIYTGTDKLWKAKIFYKIKLVRDFRH
jgi:hypothetical protein